MTQAIFRTRTRLAIVVLICVGLMVSGIATGDARASGRQYRSELLHLINQARAQRDLQPLRLDQELSRYSTRHSSAMAEADRLFHTADLAGVLGSRNWSIGTENVGYASTLRSVFRAFMNSAPHRENLLLSRADHTGVGVVRSGGSVWVTAIFYG
jgi:uncharacterized protein YkwD